MPRWDIFNSFFLVLGLKYSLIINLLLQCQETYSSFGSYLLAFQPWHSWFRTTPPPIIELLKKYFYPKYYFPLYALQIKKARCVFFFSFSFFHFFSNYQENLTLMPHMPTLMTHLQPTYFCLLISSLFFSTGFPPPKNHFLV